MKKHLLSTGLLAVLAVSCTMTEVDVPLESVKSGSHESFYATVEDQPDSEGTKTYTDQSLQIFWHEDDRITVFNDNTAGMEFYFTGETGDLGGGFDECEQQSSSFFAGSPMDGGIFAVYPHRKDTKINTSGTITYTFPDIQIYKEHSFGKEANVMVAKTVVPDRNLRFRNVGGFLAFKLYGEDVSVSSVILTANGNDALAGKGTINTSGDVPVISSMTETSDEIRLYCDKAVTLDASPDNFTEFIFVLPPMTFSEEGFTLTVLTSDGRSFSKSAAMALEIERNKIKRMAPIKVTPQGTSNLKINSLSSTRGSKTYDAETQSDGSFLLTIPTVTDFSGIPLTFTLSSSSAKLMANGQVLESGVTPVDASEGRQVELTVCGSSSEKRYILQVQNTGLPVVRIETSDFFTLSELESYKNSIQSSDNQDHRIWLPEGDDLVSITIERADGSEGMKLKGNPVYTVDTKVKGRGNYTWKWDKKPYALKFDKKTEVLDMPAHKRWILLANWRDRTLLRNDATFWLSRQSGLPYTVRGQFVELEFNGEHRGNYYLCEQIKIDENRVNITPLEDNFEDLSGGYLMEIDSYWDEVNKFRSKYFTLKYMFKEPDEDPADPEFDPRYQDGYTWMENYINEFEKVLKTRSAVANGDYNNYLNVDSAILFMLLNELSGNRDYFQNGDEDHYGPHSTYLYKDKGGLLFMGPGWDFDYETFIAQSYINQNSDNGWRGFLKTGYYYHFLRYNDDFVERVKTLWNERKEAFSGLPAYINGMVEKIELSQKFDEELWPFKNETNRNDNHDFYEGWYPRGTLIPFKTAINSMITNFNDRVTWMDDRINGNKSKGINPLGTTNPSFLFEDYSEWTSEN
ncbi:MAG: CotH kinase family protein [Bacteroidales bacterium]|nr:CotH kinase family protein [Bacteroidales bacterium]